MKKIGLSALLGLALLASCSDGGEKEAQIRLRKAEAALQQENFSEAKLQIDSIKVLYPKAFEARKQGIKLMQQVDLKEQGKTLVYLQFCFTEILLLQGCLRLPKPYLCFFFTSVAATCEQSQAQQGR